MRQHLIKSAPNSRNLVHRMSTQERQFGTAQGIENLGFIANHVPFLIRNMLSSKQNNGTNYINFVRQLIHNLAHYHSSLWTGDLNIPEHEYKTFDVEKHPIANEFRRDYPSALLVPYRYLDGMGNSDPRNIYSHPNQTAFGRHIYHLVGQTIAPHLPIDKAALAAFHDYYQEHPEAFAELQKENSYIQDPEKHQIEIGNKDPEKMPFGSGLIGNMLSHAYEQYDKHVANMNRHDTTEPLYPSPAGFYAHVMGNYHTNSNDKMTQELYKRFKHGLEKTF